MKFVAAFFVAALFAFASSAPIPQGGDSIASISKPIEDAGQIVDDVGNIIVNLLDTITGVDSHQS